MKTFSEKMERSFVELIDKRADARGWRKGEFARMVWPEAKAKSAAGKWAAIRCQASNTGKPQGVLISDAQQMADVLGEDLSYLLAVAKERARELS